MTSEIKYRLGEYIIIEHGGFLLTWESHIALGAQLSGRCFIIGNILVIGPKEHEEAGYLSLEFYEQLNKLPAWTKTSYYCFASGIRKVGTGQSVMNDLIEHPYISEIKKEPGNIKEHGSFRLGRYEITVDRNGLISWQTIGKLNRTISGKCVVESGILFIGPEEIELDNGQSRRDFFAGLKLLTQWDKTFAWGFYGSLRTCKGPELRKSYAAIWKPENVKAYITKNIPLFQGQQFRKKEFQEFSASGSEWLRTTWRRIVEWKIWSRLTTLFVAGFLTGFRFFMFLIMKCAHISLGIIDCFRAHHDHKES
jgi:hypothetical protein